VAELEQAAGAAVRAVLESYIDATFRADVARLKAIFHPAATMAGYLGGELVIGTPEPFFGDLQRHPSMAADNVAYRADVRDIRASGRIASATVYESGFFGSARILNFFTLVKVGDSWQIVSKTFETLSP
jgi:hypothetical protein